MPPAAEPIPAVSQRLDAFLRDRTDEAASWGESATVLAADAAGAVAGGKRLRARFCLAGRQAAGAPGDGNDEDAAVIGAAAALEIFHAAALVHDDLIDNSDVRRGRPATHRAWEHRHRSGQWRGDAAAFGRSAAVLIGDLLVAWSDDLLEEALALAHPSRSALARGEYAAMRREVTVGQFLDIAGEARSFAASHGADAALQVASLKSARYSIEQPLVIGAALGGAHRGQIDALRRFGHPLGMAFQLRDDLLGVFGDAQVTGKPTGDDLREGKQTLLVAYAHEALPADVWREADSMIGDRGLDDAGVRHLQRLIIESGARERVEQVIADYATRAERALEGAPLAAPAVAELRDLAQAAISRQA